jgi:hypothetical protein
VRSRALLFAALTGLACVSLHAGQALPARLNLALGTVGTLIATPGTISFQATNPNLGTVSGSSSGTVSFFVLGGSHTQGWSVSVQAGSTTFVGCPTIPTSAVRVSCSGANVSGGAGTGSCNGSFPLSTVSQQVAGGAEGDGTNSYSVTINFTLAESWRYVANPSCSFTLTYTVNAQ